MVTDSPGAGFSGAVVTFETATYVDPAVVFCAPAVPSGTAVTVNPATSRRASTLCIVQRDGRVSADPTSVVAAGRRNGGRSLAHSMTLLDVLGVSGLT